MTENLRLDAGKPHPLGVTLVASGVNIALPTSNAERVEFCLFSADGSRELARVPLPEWTDGVRHGHVAGVEAGVLYGFRVHGPYDPLRGHRFNPNKLLIDPWAKALDRPIALDPRQLGYRVGDPLADLSFDSRDSAPSVPKARVYAPGRTSARLARPHPWERALVYELHVKGMTNLHPDVPLANRGKLLGLCSPTVLEHLVRLGVTTVELMPIAAFVDEPHLVEKGLGNYWGYNPIAFMATDPRYLASDDSDELQQSIEALHDAGLEVLLDVVVNHSGEGDELGPTLSLRGLDNALYYRLDPLEPRYYVNDAGCGNVLAVDRPPVLRMVMESLRHCAAVGFDGFRFDLATTLARGERGFDANGPFLAALRQDPTLSLMKLVAEPWDIGEGGYRLGEFPPGMLEWNDRCRDTLRRFWRGDRGQVAPLGTVLAGSAQKFAGYGRSAASSLNFVTAHDGFTLRDLVSYARKHNDANGEDGRDGTDANHSWNHGVEGPSDDPAVIRARAEDLRALWSMLILARGTPMISMGDERGRSQAGNNNAYCQDGPSSWVDWATVPPEADGLEELLPALLRLRTEHPALRPVAFLKGQLVGETGFKDVAWRQEDGRELNHAEWHDQERRFLGMELCADLDGRHAALDHVLVYLNAGSTPIVAVLPEARWCWHRNFCSKGVDTPLVVRDEEVEIPSRTVTVLVDRPTPTRGIDPGPLRRLAKLAAIEPVWHDIDGNRHEVQPETQRALLRAMRLPADSPDELEASLAHMEERAWRRALAPVVVARSGQQLAFDVTLEQQSTWRSRRLHLDLVNGESRALDLVLGDHRLRASRMVDDRRLERFRVELPVALPMGIHRLSLEGHDGSATLFASPSTCHLPEWLRLGERRVGVTAHLYTLRRRGDLGIGDFTTLERLVDQVAGWGGAAIGLNPLHTLFPTEPERTSPYYPSDRRFLDIRYLDPERLVGGERDEPTRSQLLNVLRAASVARLVDYPIVVAAKQELAALAFRGFMELTGRRPDHPSVREFQSFRRRGGASLLALGRYLAQGSDDEIELHIYCQWQLESQLSAAGSLAKAKLEVGLYRDLAVGAAPDGAEVATGNGRFASGVSIGAPPDPFSRDGQVWGVPPLDPHALLDGGLEAWRELLEANMRHAGALRLDHAMGLERLFWIPEGASPKDGAYVRYPTEPLLAALAVASNEAGCMVVGEDLGTVSEGFRERMAECGILSTRVMWFERDGIAFKPAETYPRLAVACASTHDLPTIEGFWQGHDIELRAAVKGNGTSIDTTAEHQARAEEREALQQALGIDDLVDLHDAAHRFLARTPSALVLAQVEDLVGEAEQLNLPGTHLEHPNWRRRLETPVEDLAADPKASAVMAALQRR